MFSLSLCLADGTCSRELNYLKERLDRALKRSMTVVLMTSLLKKNPRGLPRDSVTDSPIAEEIIIKKKTVLV